MRQPTQVHRAEQHPEPARLTSPVGGLSEAVDDHSPVGTGRIEDDARVRWAAEQIERRGGDAELFAELIAANLDGRAWERFAEVLAIYALAVMRAWIASGKIQTKCKKKGWAIPPGWALEQDDIESLASDTVFRALERFRAAVRDGKGWQPDGGASLKTYFIEGCTNEYPNLHRSWRRRQQPRLEKSTDDPDQGMFIGQGCRLPGERLIEGEVLREQQVHFLSGLASRERELLLWHSQGYEPSEIAELLGDNSNPYDIKRQLCNLRKKVQRRHSACHRCLGAGMRSVS